MKRVLLFCFLLLSAFSYSQEVFIDGLYFQIDGDEASITAVDGYIEEELALSSIIYEGIEYPVTSIGDMAFQMCTSLKRLSMPELKRTGYGSFYFCYALTSLDLPKAEIIGNQSFLACSALSSINLPEVTVIEFRAFVGCPLTSVSLPKTIYMENSVFEYCQSLTSVSLPEVETIGGGTFLECTALTDLNLPKVESIGGSAFLGCTALTNLSLPRVETIGSSAFSGCTALTNLNLPEAASIGDEAFNLCESLTSLTLHKVAPSLGEACFHKKEIISLYVNGTEEESEGYTAENGYSGFKEIIYTVKAGIEANEAKDIKAFVDEYGILRIDGVEDRTEIYVYDIMGNLVSKSNGLDIDVQLRSGVYFIKINSKTLKVMAK